MKRRIPLWVGLVIILIVALVAGLIVYKTYESYSNTAESLGYEQPPLTVTGSDSSAMDSGYLVTPTSSLIVDSGESSGQPPFWVDFGATMPYGQVFTINFGDGSSSGPLKVEPSHGGPAAGSGIAEHTYTQDGVYIAKLLDASGNTLAIEPITVSGPVQSETIDPNSLISTDGMASISGTANSNNVFIYIEYIATWNNNYSSGQIYGASASVTNGRWSMPDPKKLDNGDYVVSVYGSQSTPLATGMLKVTGSVQPGSLIAYPSSSVAYLGVTFIASEPVGNYTINFGDGSSTQIQTEALRCPTGAEDCGGPAGVTSHTYNKDGSYTATILNASGATLGSVTIPISGSACNKSTDGGKTWQPVPCGTPPPIPQ
jgi:hypothetical protein